MKYTVISVFILAVILCFCIVNTFVVDKLCSQIIELIDAAEDEMDSGTDDSALNVCGEISSTWEKNRSYLAAVSHHEASESAENELIAMKTAAQRHNTEEFFIHSAMAKDLLEHIRGEEKLTLSNIF